MIIQEKEYLCQKYQDVKNRNDMKFTEWIKQLREERRILQRQFAAAVLDIDTASYCKIERGERYARKEQMPIIAEFLQGNKEELLTLWPADQVTAMVTDEKVLSNKVLIL